MENKPEKDLYDLLRNNSIDEVLSKLEVKGGPFESCYRRDVVEVQCGIGNHPLLFTLAGTALFYGIGYIMSYFLAGDDEIVRTVGGSPEEIIELTREAYINSRAWIGAIVGFLPSLLCAAYYNRIYNTAVEILESRLKSVIKNKKPSASSD